MITSLGSLFKALAVVSLSLLASMSENSPPAAPAEKAGFVAEVKTAQTGPCEVDAQTLCLNGGRFKVQVNWSVPSQGTNGAGTGVALTGDTGYFWFFSSNNIELVIKVVDGRGFNGKFWVFYGALSNVQYSIAITDTTTGTVRTYANPFGSLASVADTAAFDGGTIGVTGENGLKVENGKSTFEDQGPSSGPDPAFDLRPSTLDLRTSEAPCVPGDSTLCLNGGRFKVEVAWKVASQGTSGSGRAVPLTGDTGEFWFFSANNIELVIKVVDGTAFNGKFWVFYGALSDVEYKIEVTDTVTGNEKTFVNTAGNLASVADTSGFDTILTPTPTVPAPTATPTPTSTPTPTPTPTKSAGIVQVVNVGANGLSAFRDTVSLNSFTTIHVGDSVKWVFPSPNLHSTTSGVCSGTGGFYDYGDVCTPDGNWDSGQLYLGQNFTKQFLTAGSYQYYCEVHQSMMTGTVQVNP
jgi:plastocyanin